MHERLKEAFGISEANCETCEHFMPEQKGAEFQSISFCYLEKDTSETEKFPYKSEQPCWEPDFWESKQSEDFKRSGKDLDGAVDKFNKAVAAAKEASG